MPTNAISYIPKNKLKVVSITSGSTIEDKAFYNIKTLVSVSIADSVTSIGYWAFAYCDSITTVEIGDGIEAIDYYAFYGCPIEEVSLPTNAISSIPQDNLKRVIITSGESIDNLAFNECSLLISIVIPDSVTSIGNLAFYNCSSLSLVEIGNSVKSIGDWAFAYCRSLSSIKIPDSVTTIGEVAFRFCDSLSSVEIGNSVKSIGNYAFEFCDSLTSIVIPNKVEMIGDKAFSNCTSLNSIVISNSVTSIGDGAFYNTAYYNDESNWENGVLYISKYLIGANQSILGNYSIKEGTLCIAGSAFYYCDSLISIVIDDSVTSIGDRAFYGCSSLTSITVSAENEYYSSLNGNLYNKDKTTLIQYAIGKQESSFIVPNSVCAIASSAFANCSSLTSLIIHKGVTNIGSYAFNNCTLLTIYCEATSIPESWGSDWNSGNCPVYWYSENKPTTEGNYWHYGKNGEVVVW